MIVDADKNRIGVQERKRERELANCRDLICSNYGNATGNQ